MKIDEYIKKIQDLPLIKRRIIFWSVIIIFGLILFAFWIWNSSKTIREFQIEKFLEEVRIPELKEKLKEIPKF